MAIMATVPCCPWQRGHRRSDFRGPSSASRAPPRWLAFATVLYVIVLAMPPVIEASPSDSSFTTGRYTVQVRSDGSVSAYDSRNDDSGFPVWWVASGSPIVQGQVSALSVEQHGGVFVIDRTASATCTGVASASMAPSSRPGRVNEYTIVQLSGTLSGCTTGGGGMGKDSGDSGDSGDNGGTADVLMGSVRAQGGGSFLVTLQAVDVQDDSGAVFQHLQINASVNGTVAGKPFNSATFSYGRYSDEGFFGFGHQYTNLNMAGRRLQIMTEEQGVGRGLSPLSAVMDLAVPGSAGNWATSYTDMAVYLTNFNRSAFVTSPEYRVVDLTNLTLVTWEVESTSISMHAFRAASPKLILQSLTAYTGRFSPLPSWVNDGAILGLEGGSKVVSAQVKETLASAGENPPISAIWIQDWSGEKNFSGDGQLPRVGLWWNWEVDFNHYEDWPVFVSNLRKDNIRVLGYVNPMFQNISARGTPFHHNFYAEALANGYAVTTGNGTLWTGYGTSILANLTNPAARTWFKTIIKDQMIAANLSGWMSDFAEAYPFDATYTPGYTAMELHSNYPYLWAQLNREAVEEAGMSDEIVFFSRSASLRSPSVASLMWLGDQLCTWDQFDGLKTAVTGMLSGGMSGLSLQHSDIGGYTSLDLGLLGSYVRGPELLQRWCELGAFTLMYRSHPGSQPSKDAQFFESKASMSQYLRMARVFRALGFYRKQLMMEAQNAGIPVVRHMALEFPGSPAVFTEDLRLQFVVGGAVLVAPVTDPGVSSVRVFMPAGTSWQHLWSCSNYTGTDDWVTVKAPIGYPAVFTRLDTETGIGEQFRANLVEEGVLPSPPCPQVW